MPHAPTPSRLGLLAIATGVLAGCSGAPSEDDMRAALDRQMQAQVDGASHIFGGAGASLMKGMMPEVQSLKKVGCQADGEKAYRCDVELQVQQLGVTNRSVVSLRFVQASDGWTVVDP
ncbi:hypothetical protein [Macromonas nakdongensis]|uniref:hypothetical protein n=1 Tax=Macromonas nakdongensis TaxID=1843082 RepID=UPI000C31F8AC|nr:hypothetical protein [Macromonas nakdongensis]